MKRIALSLVAALASLSLTACLDDGTATQDPEPEPGQIDLDQAPSDQPEITETVDPGTSTQVIPHGVDVDGRLGSTTISINGANSVSNTSDCCVSLKASAQELPVAGRN
ncbi:MAG TPA: hypothetical protein VLB44_20585 [Kofleriaceae bacterium]|nr:hypothetical protein [Kofleriaceae bacterium]